MNTHPEYGNHQDPQADALVEEALNPDNDESNAAEMDLIVDPEYKQDNTPYTDEEKQQNARYRKELQTMPVRRQKPENITVSR